MTTSSTPVWADLRIKLENAHMHRALRVAGLEYDTPEWNEAYFEASAPVFAIWSQMKEIEREAYIKLWGKNCTFSYLASGTPYEDRRAAQHVISRLAAQLATIRDKRKANRLKKE